MCSRFGCRERRIPDEDYYPFMQEMCGALRVGLMRVAYVCNVCILLSAHARSAWDSTGRVKCVVLI
jgi:hypothetical protein